MPQLNVKLSEDKIDAIRQYAARRRTPVVSWLIKDYIDYLLAGGKPLLPPDDSPTSAELAALAQHGGAFDWLADEPELYSIEDGEPV